MIFVGTDLTVLEDDEECVGRVSVGELCAVGHVDVASGVNEAGLGNEEFCEFGEGRENK